MVHELSALIVEDSENDTFMVIRELERDSYKVHWERVETEATMKTALWKRNWDVILCDYRMPDFNAIRALEIAKESGLDIPFIIISGAIGEDLAVEAMKLGAHDYLMKGKMARLVSAVEREIREAKVRKERNRVEGRLRDTLDRLMEGCQIFSFNWKCLYVNDSLISQIHKKREELFGLPLAEIYPGIEATEMFATLNRSMKERKPEHIVATLDLADGSQGSFKMSIQPVPEGVMILTQEFKGGAEEKRTKKKRA